MATKAVMVKEMSLGLAQANLEASTKELTAAQANYVKASERLTLAEEGHGAAMIALTNEVMTVRGKCKVVSLSLK